MSKGEAILTEREKKMFTPEFDWMLAAVLFVVSVVIWMGKGDVVMKLVSHKESPTAKKKKKTEEEQKMYNRAMAVFLFVLAVSEVIAALFSYDYVWVNLITVGIVIAALVVLCIYLKKKKLL